MSTLTEMRTLVRNYLDDNNADSEENRWADTEIDFALEAALEGAIARFAKRSSRLDQQTEVTTSSGAASLVALKPLALKGVEYKSGSTFVPLAAGSFASPVLEGQDATLRVTYVGKPTFPTTAGDPVLYGSGASVNLKLFDRIVCRRAALDLLPKDGESNRPLADGETRDWEALGEIGRTPRAREMIAAGHVNGSETAYFAGGVYCRYVYVEGTQSLKLVA